MWLKVNDPRALRPGDRIMVESPSGRTARERLYHDPDYEYELGISDHRVLNKFGEFCYPDHNIYRKVEDVGDARVGDILKCREGNYCIVLFDHHDVVGITYSRSDIQVVNSAGYRRTYSRSELVSAGFKFVDDGQKTDEETVMTIAELEQKLNIKNLKIKKDEQ